MINWETYRHLLTKIDDYWRIEQLAITRRTAAFVAGEVERAEAVLKTWVESLLEDQDEDGDG